MAIFLKTVVVLSKDEEMITKLKNIFIENSFLISIMNSAFKCISKILRTNISLIIIDFEFAGDTTIELIWIIKKIRPRLPIFVVSNDNSVITLRKIVQAGIFSYAIKPIRSHEIRELIQVFDQPQTKKIFAF